MKLHVGTSGYGYKEWKGGFYPEKISPKEMLRFYGERLNAVEINYTFYHMPTERVLAPWVEQVPDDFLFALKAPQVMTHVKRLKEVGEEAEYFFTTLAILGKKLGTVLFQFPAYFHANLARLEAFLPLIPAGLQCAFEFRSPTWLEAGVGELLHLRGHTLCIADTDEHHADEVIGATPWGYLRLRRTDYGEEDLSRWLQRVRAMEWERAFVFFKHEEEGAGAAAGPARALRFRELAVAEKARKRQTG
ncbi:MAG TPA: DUF72 domain-containing protein [Geobacteraceae bacterium]